MYRFIYRTVQTARTSPVGLYESNLFSAKCDQAAAPLRATNGSAARAFSTSVARLCEKKDGVVTSNQDEKTTAGKAEEPPQPPTVSNKEAENPDPVSEQREEPVVLTAHGGDAAKPTEAIVVQAADKNVKPPAKSGKEGLLDLLGAMKVKVTNKRTMKNQREKPTFTTQMAKPLPMESTTSMYQKATGEAASSQSETLDPHLVAAASAAASTLPNSSKAKFELLQQLRQQESVTEDQKKGDMHNLGVIIADMKVGKNLGRQNRMASQIRYDDDVQEYKSDRGIAAELTRFRVRRHVFSGKRLNIFSRAAGEEDGDSAVAPPTLWDVDFAHQLSQTASQMPRNRLEEMIQWTKEGKLWEYPINNEAGLEEEASVPFHEHIFLDKHLEEGFPRQGPVRHFMELVVTGLSRNPHLTVKQKKEHIAWFRDYFQQKQDVLSEAEVYLG